jgi:hypothetical protein
MKLLGNTLFVAGLFLFMFGWVFLDLATLPLKKDLYAIDVLGTLNQLFSTSPVVAGLQSVGSVLIICVGGVATWFGAVISR